MIKDNRNAARGRTQSSGAAATSVEMKALTATSSALGTNARIIHVDRSLQRGAASVAMVRFDPARGRAVLGMKAAAVAAPAMSSAKPAVQRVPWAARGSCGSMTRGYDSSANRLPMLEAL